MTRVFKSAGIFHNHLPAMFNRKHTTFFSFRKMLKITFSQNTRSKSPRFVQCFSSCRIYATEFYKLSTYFLTSVHAFLLCFTCKELLHPVAGYLHCLTLWREEQHCLQSQGHPGWLNRWRPCYPTLMYKCIRAAA